MGNDLACSQFAPRGTLFIHQNLSNPLHDGHDLAPISLVLLENIYMAENGRTPFRGKVRHCFLESFLGFRKRWSAKLEPLRQSDRELCRHSKSMQRVSNQSFLNMYEYIYIYMICGDDGDAVLLCGDGEN